LGGGPESAGEFGEADRIQMGMDPAATHPTGSASIADKALSLEDLKKAIKDVLAETAPATPAVTVEKVAPVEPVDAKKAAIELVKALLGAMNEEPAAGVGDRSKAVPFTKAQDTGAAPVQTETMTDADWAAYKVGNPAAMKKCQRLTAQKWQAVPTRILMRQRGE